MFGISFAEFIIIFLLVLIVMGPEKIPEVARWAGKGLRELRKASNTLRNTLAMEELDELDDQQRRGPSRIADPSHDRAATATSATNSDGADPPTGESTTRDSAAGQVTPSSSDPSTGLPSSGLDQIDDDAFDRMLEEQYAAHSGHLQHVDLVAAQPTDDTITVPLDPPCPSTDLDALSVRPLRSAETAP